MMRRFIAILFIIGLALPSFAVAAVRQPALVPGALLYERTANEFASAIVVDAATGKRLYAYQPDKKWTAASLTKLLNALVAVEHHPGWDSTVSIKAADEVGGGRLRVASGATMRTRDVFFSSIVASANNAATALARLSGLGMAGFVKQMNAKAKALGMKNSVFYDASGMNPKNKTTANDLVKLATAAFGDPMIRRAATTMSYSFPIKSTGEKKKITNTNTLLTVDPDVWVHGGKTGFLYESQYNLVVKMRGYPFDAQKPLVYVVVLGSPKKDESFKTAKKLAEWAWRAYDWK